MLLKRGNKSSEVAAVQFALNGVSSFTPKLATDGIFGPRTEERVRQHQSRSRLKPDGQVGPLTFATLFESVALRGTTRITPLDEGAVRLGIGAPSLGPQPSPELAALARAHQAFLKWWAEPVPKPALPAPGLLVVPTPGPFGPVFLPRAPQVFFTPPPPTKTAQVQFTHEPDEGGNVTVHFQKETTVDFLDKRKPKETVFNFAIEWLILKGRLADLALQGTIVKKKPADAWSVEVEFSVTGGSGLALKLQSGPLDLKLAGHLAAALSSELSAQFFLGPKADAEITLIQSPDGKRAMRIFLSAQGGVKAEYGQERLPDGREVTRWQTPAFVGSASAGIGFVFP